MLILWQYLFYFQNSPLCSRKLFKRQTNDNRGVISQSEWKFNIDIIEQRIFFTTNVANKFVMQYLYCIAALQFVFQSFIIRPQVYVNRENSNLHNSILG